MRGFVGVHVRVIAVLLAAIMSWLGSVSQSEALGLPGSTATCAVFTYDDNTQAAAAPRGATKRGPPATYDYIAVNDPVGDWSGTDSGCSDRLTTTSITTYAHLGAPPQVTRATTTTGRRAWPSMEDPSSLRKTGVAANAGTRGWAPGGDIYASTKAGNKPAWSTVRGRFWKNEAANPAHGSWSDANLARMQRGLAPQRYNPKKGGMESMELSHEPIPRRRGGTDIVPRWPQDHARVDPFRFPGY